MGWYDVGGSPLELRTVGGIYVSPANFGAFVQGDVLLFTGGRSGLYGGVGLDAVAQTRGVPLYLGYHASLGADIPISKLEGLLIDASLIYYGLYPTPGIGDVPINVRLSVKYRRRF